MPLQPGSEAIVGGTVLRIPAIQSPDFVAGTSGWIIRSDGSAEFNAGTFRGSIEVGPVPGQHFIVNNAATGDVIDVYDSSNRLVFSIDQFGNVIAVLQPSLDTAELSGNSLSFFNQASLPGSQTTISAVSSATGTELIIDSGHGTAATATPSNLFFFDSAESAVQGLGGNAVILATQKGNGINPVIQGGLMQTDYFSDTNNVVHAAVYSITTDASGASNFAHNCRFTPKAGFLSCQFLAGNVGFWQYAWFTNPFTSTNANAAFRDNLGAIVASKTISAYGVFYG